jgi:hypothetical protein
MARRGSGARHGEVDSGAQRAEIPAFGARGIAAAWVLASLMGGRDAGHEDAADRTHELIRLQPLALEIT